MSWTVNHIFRDSVRWFRFAELFLPKKKIYIFNILISIISVVFGCFFAWQWGFLEKLRVALCCLIKNDCFFFPHTFCVFWSSPSWLQFFFFFNRKLLTCWTCPLFFCCCFFMSCFIDVTNNDNKKKVFFLWSIILCLTLNSLRFTNNSWTTTTTKVIQKALKFNINHK